MKVKMAKSNGIKLFVGGIDPITTRESMQAHFEQFTCVLHCKVETGKKLRLSKGFGYVTVPNMKIVEWLLSFDHVIDGKKVDIEIAIKKNKKKKVHGCFDEATPQTGGISMITTGITRKENNRPIKSILEIGSQQLTNYVTSNLSVPSGQNTKNCPDVYSSDKVLNYPANAKPVLAVNHWESPVQERLSSPWDHQILRRGPTAVPQHGIMGNFYPNSFIGQMSKHSKYEFISVSARLNEAGANYRFNLCR